MREWLVLVPFPNEKLEQTAPPEGVPRDGFHTDFLTEPGGEAGAVLTRAAEAALDDTVIQAQAVRADDQSALDFEAMYPNDPLSVVYAFCTGRSFAGRVPLAHLHTAFLVVRPAGRDSRGRCRSIVREQAHASSASQHPACVPQGL